MRSRRLTRRWCRALAGTGLAAACWAPVAPGPAGAVAGAAALGPGPVGSLPGARHATGGPEISAPLPGGLAAPMTGVPPDPEGGPLAPDPALLGDGPVASFTGPATSANARYVAGIYQRVLGREADTAGLDHHLGSLAAGGDRSRHRFTQLLLFSTEGARVAVTAAYHELLGRAAEPGGADYWTAVLGDGPVTDLRVELAASNEYVARSGGTEAAWLDALYHDALGRATDPAGASYWLGRRLGGTSRAAVAAAIVTSYEATARRAATIYHDVLGRSPSAAELATAVATIGARGERALRSRLLASDEAYEPYLEAAWP